jgi:hypothetical protein
MFFVVYQQVLTLDTIAINNHINMKAYHHKIIVMTHVRKYYMEDFRLTDKSLSNVQ